MPSDLAGNTAATARNVGTLSATPQNFTDWVDATDTNDYYRFVLNNTNRDLRLSLSGMTADANVVFYSANGTTIVGGSYNLGTGNETIIVDQMAAGTYYARVFPASSTGTNYNLSMSALISIPSDRAGNSTATARNIPPLLSSPQTFGDWVGATDTNDYYKFTLAGVRDLQLSLTGLSFDADVTVYNSGGVVIGGGYTDGIGEELVTIRNLAAGTYYARVSPFNGNTNYNLSIAAPYVDLASDTIATSRNLGVLTSTVQTFADRVDGMDPTDYYKFTLSATRNLQLTVTGMTGNADVTVYAANGTTVLGSGNAAGAANETVTINNLVAGTYYARVVANGGETNYNLGISAQVPVPPDLAGNTVSTARNLGTLSANSQVINDAIGGVDPNDYYKFTLNNASNLRLSVTNLTANADVAVYDANGTTLLANSTTLGNGNESVTIGSLAAGNYYVRVFPQAATVLTNYRFTISAAATGGPADLAGNLFTTARNIGPLSVSAQNFTDWVGATDTEDYYKFTTSASHDLVVNVSGMSADADITIYNSTGASLGSSNNDGTASESVRINNLAAGTYYAYITPYGVGATNYTLSIASPYVDLAGNTINTARNIGVIGATSLTFNDRVDNADTVDYYQFSLERTGNLQLTIAGMIADANVTVYAADGATVRGSSATVGSGNEVVSIPELNAGTYYASVTRASGETNYSMSIAAPLPVPVDRAGNSRVEAYSLDTMNATPRIVSDWVGSADTSDFYNFTLASVSNLRLSLSGMSADADVRVFADNSSTNALASSGADNNANEAINIDNLAAGSYFVEVYRSAGDTNYTLTMSAPESRSSSSLTDQAGNMASTARDIGVMGPSVLTYSDWVGSTDRYDYYRFEVSDGTSDLALTVGGLTADVDVAVFSSGASGVGTNLGGSYNLGTASESISIERLAVGSYYARVVSYSGDTNYNMTISAVRSDGAGNTTATAIDLGLLSATAALAPITDWIGGVDINDYYKFTLDSTRNLRLTVTGMAADANVTVYAVNGTTIVGTSSAIGSNSEAINIDNLAAGTYYARIVPTSGANTNYTIAINAPSLFPVEQVSNNTVLTARAVGDLLTTARTFNDWVGSSDTTDYYRFTLNPEDAGRNLRLTVTGMTANADVKVYGADGTTVLSTSAAIGTSNEMINIDNLADGTYYAQVFTTGTASTNYILNLSAQANPLTNNSIVLTGSSFADTLTGGTGDDILTGAEGDDTLTGVAGSDTFRFVTTVNTGIDTITDFRSGVDKIRVVSPNFANIPVGTLAANRFVSAGTALTNSNAVFIYNGTTGGLSFDRDGNGVAAAVQFATLGTGARTLIASDIQVVAA